MIKVKELDAREIIKIGLRPNLSESLPHIGATKIINAGIRVKSNEI
jgi:hypothetical protein